MPFDKSLVIAAVLLCCCGVSVHAGESIVFGYIAPSIEVPFEPEGGTTSFTAVFSIGQTEAGDFPTQGFSMGCASDPLLLQATEVRPAGPVQELNGGTGPDFFQGSTYADGWTVGVVYGFLGGISIEFEVERDAVEVDYDGTATGSEMIETPLEFNDQLGEPPVANVVVVSGASLPIVAIDGLVALIPDSAPSFIRGDCNSDTRVDIADGIWILNEIFFAGPPTTCPVACDANDDQLVDSADATYLFDYRFLDGPPPSAPFPACGAIGDVDCETSSCVAGGD